MMKFNISDEFDKLKKNDLVTLSLPEVNLTHINRKTPVLLESLGY